MLCRHVLMQALPALAEHDLEALPAQVEKAFSSWAKTHNQAVFDAYPAQVLNGTVWRLVPAVDRLTKSSDVLVQLPAVRPALQLDLTATVNVVTGVVDGAVVVPRDALEGGGERRSVYLVAAGSRAARRAITVGVCDEHACQVREGLAAGERVISPVPAGLKDGTKVRPL